MIKKSFEAPSSTQTLIDRSWGARFRTTRWSVILAAASEGELAKAAFSSLYRAYFYPLVAQLARYRGREGAAELTQAFFVEHLMGRGALSKVERQPGKRFRGWLRTSLRRFSASRVRREKHHVPLGAEGEAHALPVCSIVAREANPEQEAERKRALRLLADALATLRRRYCEYAARSGHDGEARFELARRVFLPRSHADALDLDTCARQLGIGVDATKHLIGRLRKSYGRLLDDTLRREICSDLPRARRWLHAALDVQPSPTEGA